MDLIKTEIEKRLKKKRGEISSLEADVERYEDLIADRKDKIALIESTLQELQSLYNLIPTEADVGGPQPTTFRQNSDGWLVHEILRQVGKPLYVDQILEQLGREIDSDTRGSLAGQLGSYVRKGQVFTRPKPNTFGLREWEVNGKPRITTEGDILGDGEFTIRATIPIDDIGDETPALILPDDEDE